MYLHAIRNLAAAAALTVFAAPVMAEPSGTITVYTSQPSEQMQAVVDAFNKDYPNVKVDVFRSGTTEVMSRLQAELTAGSSPADVVLLADAVALTQLKNAGQLQPYADAPVGAIPAALVDPDKTYFGTKLITTGIVYNTNLVQTPPKSWKDLTQADIAAKTIMPSPLYSGAAVIHLGTMVQQGTFGWPYYEELARNGAVAGQGNGTVIEAVAKGEKTYGIIIEYMALNAKKKGSPVDFVFPEEGVTSISQPVAILKGTDNEEAAKAFVDWQLSGKAQEQSVAQGYFPIIDGVSPPEGYPAVSSLKILPTNYADLLTNDEANKKKFSELFGG